MLSLMSCNLVCNCNKARRICADVSLLSNNSLPTGTGSCFCCRTGGELTLLTSPVCCTQEITAKSSKADDGRFPGDHRQQIWCCFSPIWVDENREAFQNKPPGLLLDFIFKAPTISYLLLSYRMKVQHWNLLDDSPPPPPVEALWISSCVFSVNNILSLTWKLPIWMARGGTARCWIFHCYWISLSWYCSRVKTTDHRGLMSLLPASAPSSAPRNGRYS